MIDKIYLSHTIYLGFLVLDYGGFMANRVPLVGEAGADDVFVLVSEDDLRLFDAAGVPPDTHELQHFGDGRFIFVDRYPEGPAD